jgi:hypothetical protein
VIATRNSRLSKLLARLGKSVCGERDLWPSHNNGRYSRAAKVVGRLTLPEKQGQIVAG